MRRSPFAWGAFVLTLRGLGMTVTLGLGDPTLNGRPTAVNGWCRAGVPAKQPFGQSQPFPGAAWPRRRRAPPSRRIRASGP